MTGWWDGPCCPVPTLPTAAHILTPGGDGTVHLHDFRGGLSCGPCVLVLLVWTVLRAVLTVWIKLVVSGSFGK